MALVSAAAAAIRRRSGPSCRSLGLLASVQVATHGTGQSREGWRWLSWVSVLWMPVKVSTGDVTVCPVTGRALPPPHLCLLIPALGSPFALL